MKLQVLIVLICLLAASLAGGVEQQTQPDKDVVRVMVIGDRMGRDQAGRYEKAVRDVVLMQPDIVLSAGDQIYYEREDVDYISQQWRDYFAIIKPITMPMLLCPGNHDIFSPAGEQSWRKMTGHPPYYSYDFGKDHYVILDSGRYDDPGSIPREQLEWLRSDLVGAQKARYRIIICHRPYWFEDRVRKTVNPLNDIFKNGNVNLVISGHYHLYFCDKRDGITYIDAPSSAGYTTGDGKASFYGYLWLTLSDGGISFVPLQQEGVLAPEQMTADRLTPADILLGKRTLMELLRKE